MDETGDDLIRRAAEHGLFDEASEPTCIAGRYDLLEEIGRGGFGAVWRARDRTLGREVAVKLLKINEPEEVARFELEARVAAKLRHAHVVSVHDVGLHDGRPYLVMDLIDGKPLSALVGTLGADQLGRLLAKAARGLGAAHASGVVHRDVKPGNILVDAGGEPFVTDFGLAKPLAGESGVKTMTGTIMGTPMYMAPEQAAGDLQRISPRSDVFSLGVVLYEILAGRNPFLADNVPKILDRVQQYDPPPPSRRGKRVPVELDWVCMKALEKDPSRRYADANEFAADLERFYRGEHVTARPASLLYRAAKRIRRNPWAWGMGAAAAGLIAVAAIAGGKWRKSEKELLRARLETALRRAERDVAQVELTLTTREEDPSETLKSLDGLAVELTSLLGKLPDPDGFAALGTLYRTQGKLESAEAAYLMTLKLRSDDAVVHSGLAAIHFEWGRRCARSAQSTLILDEQGDLISRSNAHYQRAAEHLRRSESGRELADALAAYANLEFQAAVEILLDIERNGQTTRESKKLQAQVLYSRGSWSAAAGCFEEAHGRRRTDVDAMLGCVESWLEQSRELFNKHQDPNPTLRVAEQWIARTLRVAPGNPDALLSLSTVFKRKGDWSASQGRPGGGDWAHAIVQADYVVGHHPRIPRAYLARGRACMSISEDLLKGGKNPLDGIAAAIRDFSTALDLAGNVGLLLIERGEAHRLRARYQSTIGLDSLPDLERARSDFQQAARGVGMALTCEELVATTLVDLALEQTKRGLDAEPTFREAIDAFTRVLDGAPDHPTARGNRGLAWSKLGQVIGRMGRDSRHCFEHALEDLDSALAGDANDPDKLMNKASVLVALAELDAGAGRDASEGFRGAIAAANSGVSRAPRNADYLHQRSVIWSQWADLVTAKGEDPGHMLNAAHTDLMNAIKLRGNFAAAYGARAIVRLQFANRALRLGQDPLEFFKGGVEDFEKAVELDPGYRNAFQNMGIAHVNWSEAVGGVSTEEGRMHLQAALRAFENARAIAETPTVLEWIDSVSKALQSSP